jgi:hypothetical protein
MAKKRFETTPERQMQMKKLGEYFDTQPDGEEFSWDRIESETRIPMRPRGPGRALVWKTLKRLKRPYEAIVGIGLRLSSPETALTIVHGKFRRMDGAVRVATRTQKILSDLHLDKMSGDEQRKMIMAAAFFATVRMIVQENREQMPPTALPEPPPIGRPRA